MVLHLQTNGIEMIPYPKTTRAAVHSAAEAWKTFLALPQHSKDLLAADDPHITNGYERTTIARYRGNDSKENFDITRQGIAAMRQLDSLPPAAHALLDACDTLLDQLVDVGDAFCNHIENDYGIAGFRKTGNQSARNRFVRLLYYPPVPEGTIVGEAHTDHSGYTFHLYESTDGCYGLSVDDATSWFAMPVAPNEMAAFGGMQLQLMSRGNIRALCHKITANKVTARKGRIAIVCFNLLDNVPTYDRTTHGRVQEKRPGFNYHMNTTDFSKLFTT